MFLPWLYLFETRMNLFCLHLAVLREFLSEEAKEQLFAEGSQQENKHSRLVRGYFSLLCNLFPQYLCLLLWITKCVCVSKHQTITLPLPAWETTLQGILVIHIFCTLCNTILYWIKWIWTKNMIWVYFPH